MEVKVYAGRYMSMQVKKGISDRGNYIYGLNRARGLTAVHGIERDSYAHRITGARLHHASCRLLSATRKKACPRNIVYSFEVIISPTYFHRLLRVYTIGVHCK
jgi:hypothetical protein